MVKQTKHIIVVSTYTIKKKFIFQRLKQLGHKVTVVNTEVNWAEPYVHDWILADTRNHDQVIRRVGDYLKKHTIDGILTFLEDDVLLTAKLNEKFKFIGIPYSVAMLARNKYQFRQFCYSNGIPAPKYKIVSQEHESDDLDKISTEFNFPVVVKPAFGSSSAYVIKADDKSEMLKVYNFIKKNLSTQIESALTDGCQILIEEYIDGDEVDIDILVQNGKIKFYSISDNYQTNEPFFVETGQSIPTTLPQTAQDDLINIAEETLEKMNIINGCIHFEAKHTSDGAVPIEVNLRMGGDEVWSFVKHAWRVDLIEQAVNIACGVFIPKIIKPTEPYTYVSGRYYLANKSGILSKLDIPKKFNQKLHVQDVNFFKHIGDAVFTPPADYDFMGWITAKGENSNDARDNLNAAYKQLKYQIIPFDSTSTVGKTHRFEPNKSAFLVTNLRDIKRQAPIEKLRFMDLDQQRRLHIGIACNSYNKEEGTIESELSSVGKNLQTTLDQVGYKTTYIDFNDLDKAIHTLQDEKIDLIFNVCERINNSSLLEPHAAGLFDAFRIPYTGSNPFTLGLCIDKIRVKKLLTYHHIPTAKWDYMYDINDEINTELKFPLIVKPANTDNSIGVSNDSVVTNHKQLMNQVEYVLKELRRPVLIEEYLEGDEYDVSIIGSEDEDLAVLPLSRNIFNMPEGIWNIWTTDYKFGLVDTHKKYIKIQQPPKKVNKKLIALISEMALDTYNILDCHDYGRVDIKLDKDGNPHVLELNPNPSINIGDCVPNVAQIAGYNYTEFIEKIISLTIKRYKNRPPYYHLQTSSL